MNNADTIFTRTRFGLDTRVWLTMLLVLFISLFLLSFKMATRVVCSDYSITPVAVTAGKVNSFYTGETIVFSASVASDSHLVWDFSDGTAPTSGNRIKHTFLHDGNYTVTSTLNGTCMQSVNINVKEFVSKTPALIAPAEHENIISGTDTPHVGESAVYFSSKTAETYEWSILNSPEYPTLSDSKASYKFEIPGSRIIVLKINGDDKKIYKKSIIVLPALKQKTTASTIHTAPVILVPLPPKITYFNPTNGTTGTAVTIVGSNFTDASAVSFGGTPAASFAVLSPTTISATVGAGATGNISVTTKNGVSVLPVFTYNAPVAAPTTPKFDKPKIMMIPDEEFKHLFDQVCDGKLDASGFTSYLCKGDKTLVLANNEWKSLGAFCDMLKGKKKGLLRHKEYSIKSVKVTRDAANQNCVTNLTVEYK